MICHALVHRRPKERLLVIFHPSVILLLSASAVASRRPLGIFPVASGRPLETFPVASRRPLETFLVVSGRPLETFLVEVIFHLVEIVSTQFFPPLVICLAIFALLGSSRHVQHA
jgi:hypothetical protein